MTAAETVRTSRKKHPSVLIVDDNVGLATCLEMLLEAHDYEVWRTSDGVGGLESIKLKDFDVVLCDMVLPGLSGELLHAAVHVFKPSICHRFIFMSGHPDKARTEAGEFCMGRPVFRKPFALDQLLNGIENVVNSTSGELAKSV
ncbi:MAG TPA: response regulator [Patescibacteria group bacterium]|jgi:DNA-binding NtrC family response regulator|nr:response regulator [Patescibacteria group bacterium]